MGAQSHPERVHVEKDGASGGVGEGQAPVEKQEIEAEEDADDSCMAQVPSSQPDCFPLSAGIDPEERSGHPRPDRGCQQGWDTLIADPDADRVPSPKETDQQ